MRDWSRWRFVAISYPRRTIQGSSAGRFLRSLARSSSKRASSWRSIRSRLKLSGTLPGEGMLQFTPKRRSRRAAHRRVTRLAPLHEKRKGAPRGASLLPKPNNLRRLSGRLRLLGAFLLDLLDLVEQVVGLLLQTCSLVRGFHHVRLAPINEAEVAHRVVVVRFDLESLLQSGNAFIHKRAAFGNVFRAHGGGEPIRVLHLLLQVVLVVLQPPFPVDAIRAGSIHYPHPVVRVQLLWPPLDY